MLRRPKKFVRPRTFQLVQPPHTQQPEKVPPKPKPPGKPASSSKPKVKPKPKKPKPVPAEAKPAKAKPQPKEEENVDELAELLEALPAPAELTVLNPDFNYNYYDNFVRRKIEQYWNPPSERPGMSVVVTFDILTSGRAVNISISEASGDPSLDNLALRAVKLASPFGKLPVKYHGQKVTYRVTLIPVRK
jgi:protein TonB